MRYTVVRCDECGKDEWLIFPAKSPEGWRKKITESGEVWDLCRRCDRRVRGLPATVLGETNRFIVERLLRDMPRANDREIAAEAAAYGIQMSGETVRRHRVALGVPVARTRKRGLREAVFFGERVTR
jgi:hypothetical protein